ncbi:MAG TPA: STAS domain-containing protein [Burkholderiales bacterium]|jgi:anti-anti-sigma factor|nr:STAS domain-containing protein [Burkholderiales bacterium]
MLDLKEENSGLVTVLSVKGRIDSTTAPKLDERLSALLGAASARVLMDFSQLEYISSAGFRVLLLAGRRAEESTSRFVLCGVSGKVRQLFDLGSFLDLFTIVPSREEGIVAVS